MSSRSDQACRCCGAVFAGPVLDFGSLPACNGFLERYAAPATHPLAMTECQRCGLVQLAVCPPVEFVVPRVGWISYREPEAHLGDLVTSLQPLLPRGARTLGVGPFDPPLTERLENAGFRRNSLDLMKHVDVEPGTYPYLETLQERMSAAELAPPESEKFDLVVCRYLLEHSHEPLKALLGLQRLLDRGGKLVVEVPDCEKFLRRSDYSFAWEEHICYFSEATLRQLAIRAGLRVLHLVRYEGALEDALVAVLESSDGESANAPTATPSGIFKAYVDEFPRQREMWRRRLGDILADGRKIALLGVGHQAVMFLNVFGLQDFVSRVADDQPAKQGYYPPGISAPVVSSSTLADDPEVGSWLLAVNPQVQINLRSRFAALLQRGVRMYSIISRGLSGTGANLRPGAGRRGSHQGRRLTESERAGAYQCASERC
jgi:SAM-dependent methyltransferase